MSADAGAVINYSPLEYSGNLRRDPLKGKVKGKCDLLLRPSVIDVDVRMSKLRYPRFDVLLVLSVEDKQCQSREHRAELQSWG